MLGLTLERAGRDRGLRVLALGAHADDIEIGCGGTVLTWSAEASSRPRPGSCSAVRGTGGRGQGERGAFLDGVADPTVSVRRVPGRVTSL